jgi:hypothetical protein
MDASITKFIFRVFKEGDVIALSPHEQWSETLCASYQTIGGHSGADYHHCVSATRQATDIEAAPLIAELERLGYRVQRVRKYIRK